MLDDASSATNAVSRGRPSASFGFRSCTTTPKQLASSAASHSVTPPAGVARTKPRDERRLLHPDAVGDTTASSAAPR
eukprot:11182031-Lingulodinium_polyedra.AAC.1